MIESWIGFIEGIAASSYVEFGLAYPASVDVRNEIGDMVLIRQGEAIKPSSAVRAEINIYRLCRQA
jgi:hypothetical protein